MLLNLLRISYSKPLNKTTKQLLVNLSSKLFYTTEYDIFIVVMCGKMFAAKTFVNSTVNEFVRSVYIG